MKATPRLLFLRPSSAPSHLIVPRKRTTPATLPSRITDSRQFISNPLTPIQTLTASRILPYHAAPIYNLIADISSYPSFIPYCTSSTITSTSSPDPTHHKTWPRTAELRVGWGSYNELFRSAVYCAPYQILEAVAGDATHTIPHDKLPHYYSSNQPEDASELSANNPIFTSLLTRWMLHEFPFKPAPPDGKTPQPPSRPRTEVSLVIEVRFASAVYSALSQAAAPKVAGMMVEAFEKRAREVLGDGEGEEGEVGKGDGVESALDGVLGGKGTKEEP